MPEAFGKVARPPAAIQIDAVINPEEFAKLVIVNLANKLSEDQVLNIELYNRAGKPFAIVSTGRGGVYGWGIGGCGVDV